MSIRSKPPSKEYDTNWDRIFGRRSSDGDKPHSDLDREHKGDDKRVPPCCGHEGQDKE